MLTISLLHFWICYFPGVVPFFILYKWTGTTNYILFLHMLYFFWKLKGHQTLLWPSRLPRGRRRDMRLQKYLVLYLYCDSLLCSSQRRKNSQLVWRLHFLLWSTFVTHFWRKFFPEMCHRQSVNETNPLIICHYMLPYVNAYMILLEINSLLWVNSFLRFSFWGFAVYSPDGKVSPCCTACVWTISACTCSCVQCCCSGPSVMCAAESLAVLMC